MEEKQEQIRLIILEDSEDDALLLIRMLKKSGMNLESMVCSNENQFVTTIDEKEYDIIISDFDLNGFTGLDAFQIHKNTGNDVPFIIVSGAIGEELAVQAMRQGVHDYLMKDNLERLIPVIDRELKEAKLRREQSLISKALGLEKHKFELLVENAPIGIMIVAKNGQIKYINSMTEEIFGFSNEELETIPEMIPKLFSDTKESQWIIEFWSNIFDPSIPLPNIEFPLLRTRDGSPKYIKFKSSPIDDDSFILMAEDVTHQKVASITLERSQKRLAQIFDTVEDIIIEVIHENEKLVISNVNKSFTENTGHEKLDVLNRPIEELFDHQELIDSFYSTIKKQNDGTMELQLDFPSGSRYWEIFISPIFTDNGSLYRIILNARDLTKRKKQEMISQNNEKKFRIVSSLASDAIWEWNSDTKCIEWNDGVTTLFGYKNESLGHSISWVLNTVHPADLKFVKESFNKVLHDQNEHWSTDLRFKCLDGSYKNVQVSGHIFYNKQKDPIRIMGAMVDHTHILKAEELRIKSLVEGADNERKIISEELHDNLGQNLTLSTILLEQLQQEYDDQRLEKVSAIVHDVIDKTRNLAHSLMPKTVHDFGLKAGILSLNSSIALAKSFNINTNFNFEDDRFNPQIETNLFRIVQEAMNNIIKYAKAKNVFIQMHRSNNTLMLTIEDDGVGFDVNDQRLKDGVGLKNIENRVFYLNGKRTIESNVGQGTLILIELPIDDGIHK